MIFDPFDPAQDRFAICDLFLSSLCTTKAQHLVFLASIFGCGRGLRRVLCGLCVLGGRDTVSSFQPLIR